MISNSFPKFSTGLRTPVVFPLQGSTVRDTLPVLNTPRAPRVVRSIVAGLSAGSWRNDCATKFKENAPFPFFFGHSRLLAQFQERISATNFTVEQNPRRLGKFPFQLDAIEKLDAPLAERMGRYASLLSEKALSGLITLVSDELTSDGRVFSEQFLPFLEILLRPLDAQALAESFAIPWLESYAAMQEAGLKHRQRYFYDWAADFFRSGTGPAPAMIEGFLLSGKLASAVKGKDRPRILKTEASRESILIDPNRSAWIRIETQAARTDNASALGYLLREAAEYRLQARKFGVTNFQYHFLGPDLPKEWVARLAKDFGDSPLVIYQYPGGIHEPQLIFPASTAQESRLRSSWTEDQIQIHRRISALDASDRQAFLRDLRRTEETYPAWVTDLSPQKRQQWLHFSNRGIDTALWLRIGARLDELSETAVAEFTHLLRENLQQASQFKTSPLGSLVARLFPAPASADAAANAAFAEPWLMAHRTLRMLDIRGRGKYLLDWLSMMPLLRDAAAFRELMEQYLLFARLAYQRSGQEQLAPGFIRISNGMEFSLEDRNTQTWLSVEAPPAQETPEKIKGMQQSAKKLRDQARAAGIQRFEYHLVGNEASQLWLASLQKCFAKDHFKVFWRRSWNEEPVLLAGPSGKDRIPLQAEALQRLPKLPRFREALHRGIVTQQGRHGSSRPSSKKPGKLG